MATESKAARSKTAGLTTTQRLQEVSEIYLVGTPFAGAFNETADSELKRIFAETLKIVSSENETYPEFQQQLKSILAGKEPAAATVINWQVACFSAAMARRKAAGELGYENIDITYFCMQSAFSFLAAMKQAALPTAQVESSKMYIYSLLGPRETAESFNSYLGEYKAKIDSANSQNAGTVVATATDATAAAAVGLLAAPKRLGPPAANSAAQTGAKRSLFGSSSLADDYDEDNRNCVIQSPVAS
jgi:hypothetical protein